jgi:hypothetical protein
LPSASRTPSCGSRIIEGSAHSNTGPKLLERETIGCDKELAPPARAGRRARQSTQEKEKRQMKKLIGIVVMMGAVAACGGNGSPTAPSSPYPAVAGNYAGTITINYTSVGVSVNCPATTTVTQSGANVTLSQMNLGGACAGVFPSIPPADNQISTTGSLGSVTLNNLSVPSCGFYNVAASGGFSGTSFQFSFVYTAVSTSCQRNPGNFSIGGTLSR